MLLNKLKGLTAALLNAAIVAHRNSIIRVAHSFDKKESAAVLNVQSQLKVVQYEQANLEDFRQQLNTAALEADIAWEKADLELKALPPSRP